MYLLEVQTIIFYRHQRIRIHLSGKLKRFKKSVQKKEEEKNSSDNNNNILFKFQELSSTKILKLERQKINIKQLIDRSFIDVRLFLIKQFQTI